VALTPLDFLVLAVYVLGVTAWGVWLGRGQKAASQYFLGGRELPWPAVLFSIVATETSTLTFLSIPGVAYATDLSFLQLTFGYLLGRTVIAFILLPAYYKGELATAYTFLAGRFGQATRRLASGIFMVTRSLADGVRLFATAIPLALITGWDYPVAILAIGVATLIYTFYGGIRAVVWVDVLQMGVYLAGGIATLVVVSLAVPGGLGGVLEAAAAAGKTEIFRFDLDLSQAHTIWAGLLGGAFLSMASHGTDQLIVQRLLTCRDLPRARLALIGSGVMVIFQFSLFLIIGLALWGFYGGAEFARTDEIFATFLVEGLPPGLSGLVIAAIFAAAMSTLSSSLNALASSATYDIYAPLRGGEEGHLLRVGRWFTLMWAMVLVGGATVVRGQDTPVVELGLAIASFTYGGLLGAFLLGLLVRRAVQRDAIIAMGVGMTVMTVVVFAGWWASLFTVVGMHGAAGALEAFAGSIAWPWHVVIGSLLTLGIGTLASFLPARRRAEVRE